MTLPLAWALMAFTAASARSDRNVGAGGGEARRDAVADALAATGDDGGAVGERDIHLTLPPEVTLRLVWSNITSNQGAVSAPRAAQPTAFWYSAYPGLNTMRIRANSRIRRGIAATTGNEARDWLSLFGSLPRPQARMEEATSLAASAQFPVEQLETGEIQSVFFGPFGSLAYAHMLAIATSWAETLGARRIYIGAVAEDSSGYPDCRPEFYEAFQKAIDAGTKPETKIEIVTPVISLTKSEIVRRGLELGAPLELTWSCYAAEDRACGRCDSCLLRLKGFEEAGLIDPLAYQAA